MLSLYVDKNIKTDEAALANYSLEVINTQFSNIGNISQMFYYTVGGRRDLANNPYQNQIMVAILPPKKDNDALKIYATDIIKRYKFSGMEIPTYEGKEITINGK